MKADFFDFEDVAGTQQRLVDKVEIIQNANGSLDFIYYIWAFGCLSLLITILGMIPYFVNVCKAPPTKKRKYYLIISNLSIIFSFTGLLSILYGDQYIGLAIQKVFEALALNAFRKLMLGYIGDARAFFLYAKDQGKQNFWRVPPCCCFIPPCLLPNNEFNKAGARLLQLFTRQFIIVAPVVSFVMLFFAHGYPEIAGKTESTEKTVSYAMQICRAVLTFSTLFALYAVFVGWKLTRKLTQFNITKKFALFKIFILLSLVQEYILQFLMEQGILKVGNTLYPPSQMLIVVLGVLLCIEGILVMIFLQCTNAFSPNDLMPSNKVSRKESSLLIGLDDQEKEGLERVFSNL